MSGAATVQTLKRAFMRQISLIRKPAPNASVGARNIMNLFAKKNDRQASMAGTAMYIPLVLKRQNRNRRPAMESKNVPMLSVVLAAISLTEGTTCSEIVTPMFGKSPCTCFDMYL